MFKLRPLPSALFAAALTAAAPTHAEGTNPTQPVAFDYYLLSLSVEPSFCALSSHNRSQPECKSLTAASFQQTPLTVHGLWPNRVGASVNRQPQDCSGAKFSIPPPTAQQLQQVMPGGEHLERHEWETHGTCSGLSPADYFAAIVRLDQQANAIIGPLIRDAAGDTLEIAALMNAIAARQPTLAPSVIVYCQTAKGGAPTVVSEIRLVLAKDLTPRAARTIGLAQNSGCPHGAGRIPAPGH